MLIMECARTTRITIVAGLPRISSLELTTFNTEQLGFNVCALSFKNYL